MTYNFFSAYFKADLVLDDDSVIPFWQGPVDPKIAKKVNYKSAGAVKSENMAIASDLTVELSLGGYFMLKLDLRPTPEDALALINSNAIIIGLTRLRVEFGYTGAGSIRSPLYTGIILEPEFTIGAEYSLSFKAHASVGVALRRSQATRQFSSKTRAEIVTALAAGSGSPAIPLKVDTSKVTAEKEKKLLLQNKINYEQGGKNNLLAIADVLAQCLCTYRIEDDPKSKTGGQILVVLDRISRFGSPPVKTLRLFNPQNPSIQTKPIIPAGEFYGPNVLPLLSVSTQSKQVFLPGVTRGFIKQTFDEKAKQAKNKVQEVDKILPGPVAGAGATPKKKIAKGLKNSKFHPKAKLNKGGGGAVKTGDHKFPTQSAKADYDLVQAQVDAGVQLELETVLAPDIQPGVVVRVEGMGLKFDGTYAIHKVTHTIGANNVTKMSAISNGGFLAKDSEAYGDSVNSKAPQATDKKTKIAKPQ